MGAAGGFHEAGVNANPETFRDEDTRSIPPVSPQTTAGFCRAPAEHTIVEKEEKSKEGGLERARAEESKVDSSGERSATRRRRTRKKRGGGAAKEKELDEEMLLECRPCLEDYNLYSRRWRAKGVDIIEDRMYERMLPASG